MRVRTGRAWIDLGPGAASGGLSSGKFNVGLSEERPTTQVKSGSCPICGGQSIGGRVFCSARCAKLGYGNGVR